MKFILFPFLALILLIYLLIVSYKKKWNLKVSNNQSPLSRLSTFKYYFWLIVLIITMICLVYKGLIDFSDKFCLNFI